MKSFPTLTHFDKLSTRQFLKEYWQKKPLVIRNAFPDFQAPLSADELAGFSLDEDVNSRLVMEMPDKCWVVEHGPFDESRFNSLPESHWTLLVQHVDSLDPNVNALLNAFRFIPDWRLDDIMISYAADKGSVGPHFDYYDVFLLQAQGSRRWKLGQSCDASTPLLPDQDMKILADFQEQEETLLEPGDMLYIPPGVAHWGIAEGECMTISIGFRAPSHAELLLELAQDLASQLSEDQRYRDPDLQIQNNPGEILPEVITRLSDTLSSLLADKQQLADTFGRLMTQPKSDIEFHSDSSRSGHYYRLRENVRCAWFGSEAFVTLYINGESYRCTRELACTLSNRESLDGLVLSNIEKELLENLKESGYYD